MQYKYAKKKDYEDYACGRVIYQKSGSSNFPVRLACEVFQRCLSYCRKKDNITLYDPCCGSAYTLTVLGFIFKNRISYLIGSDVNKSIIEYAKTNLKLLSSSGLMFRKQQIQSMIKSYNKQSHKDALRSLQKLMSSVNDSIKFECFDADILNIYSLIKKQFTADIVFADVPYGNLAQWSVNDTDNIDILLDTIIPVIAEDSVIAVSSLKKQKINTKKYIRMEKFKIGKRKIEILKAKRMDE